MQEDNKAVFITKEEWNNLEIDYKNQFYMNDQEELILVIANKPEINIGKVDIDGFKAEHQKLVDTFTNLTKQHQSLLEKWNASDDKLKLKNDVKQLDISLNQDNYLGDSTALSEFVLQAKEKITEIYEQNASVLEQLVVEAETIKESDDWHSVTDQYKTIIDKWKQGPEVKRSVNEAFWQRINTAKDFFFERKRAHYEDLEKVQMINLDLKIELCEKAEALSNSQDWKSTTETMQQLMEEWKKIGHLPSQEKNDEMWERFSTARNNFFDRKEAHTNRIKVEQEENYRKKLALVEQVEALKDATQWKEVSEKMKALQEEWKKIGRVLKEHNDELWDRWRAARDHFYDAKRANAVEYKKVLEENYEKKKIITQRAEHLVESTNWKTTTNELAELMTEWKTIGPVSREHGDDLWDRFNKARRDFFKRKDADREKRKKYYQQKEADRIKQTLGFLDTLKAEQKEDENRLAEFKESVQNITGEDKKDNELKQHLLSLIEKIEIAIPKRSEKIIEVAQQLEALQTNTNEGGE